MEHASSPQVFLCDDCGSDFAKRTAFAKVLRVVLVTFYLILSLVVLAAFLSVIATHLR